MPAHDWTLVDAGTFHAFHVAWIAELQKKLNGGVLPADFYAMAEQVGGNVWLDDVDFYVRKACRLVIRHASNDRVVAIVEILSPGNKCTRAAMAKFVDRVCGALDQGHQLLLIDLFPPGAGAPHGVHGALWAVIRDGGFDQPRDKLLTLAAYSTADSATAYVEPFGVGDALADMPLFLGPDSYVSVPLEATYRNAWEGMPQRWRSVLEGTR